jgi:hypothetical protein
VHECGCSSTLDGVQRAVSILTEADISEDSLSSLAITVAASLRDLSSGLLAVSRPHDVEPIANAILLALADERLPRNLVCAALADEGSSDALAGAGAFFARRSAKMLSTSLQCLLNMLSERTPGCCSGYWVKLRGICMLYSRLSLMGTTI